MSPSSIITFPFCITRKQFRQRHSRLSVRGSIVSVRLPAVSPKMGCQLAVADNCPHLQDNHRHHCFHCSLCQAARALTQTQRPRNIRDRQFIGARRLRSEAGEVAGVTVLLRVTWKCKQTREERTAACAHRDRGTTVGTLHEATNG